MTIFGILITYACSWWLTLFMVLPWRVKVPAVPPAGHAASAPSNPMLRKKLLITTVLAVLPTILMYLVIGSVARAEDGIYHAGPGKSPCDSVEYQSSADVSADTVQRREDVHMGLNLPATDYTKGNDTVDLRASEIYLGDVSVSPDGQASLNGRPLSAPSANANGCK